MLFIQFTKYVLEMDKTRAAFLHVVFQLVRSGMVMMMMLVYAE